MLETVSPDLFIHLYMHMKNRKAETLLDKKIERTLSPMARSTWFIMVCRQLCLFNWHLWINLTQWVLHFWQCSVCELVLSNEFCQRVLFETYNSALRNDQVSMFKYRIYSHAASARKASTYQSIRSGVAYKGTVVII